MTGRRLIGRYFFFLVSRVAFFVQKDYNYVFFSDWFIQLGEHLDEGLPAVLQNFGGDVAFARAPATLLALGDISPLRGEYLAGGSSCLG